MTAKATNLLRRIGRGWRRLGQLCASRKGNVSMLFGFALVPLVFSVGMGVDYGRAMRLQTRLNVAADAAALAAVSRPAMPLTAAQAKLAAYQMFVAQARSFVTNGDLALNFFDPAQLTINVTDTVTANNKVRTVSVSYFGKSNNTFSKVLAVNTLNVRGGSTSTASDAPNIDFYVMMDTSPSMLLPATSAGLTQMMALTPDNCAFACHITGSNNDYYALARNNNIVLRTDLVFEAVQDLADTIQQVESQNNTSYRMGLSSFDYGFRPIWPKTPNSGRYVDQSLSAVKAHVSDAEIVSYCANNHRLCGIADNDTSTNFTTAMGGINALMPAPGGGSNNVGDTPQEVLFIITDGMRDEMLGGTRLMGPMPAALCDTIKARGIRIAILNTEYLPESASDGWSIANVRDPYLAPTDRITPALQSCASPGLFYQVTTNGDISEALGQLFQAVVTTARLTS